MSTTDGTFWTPLGAPTTPVSAFEPSIAYSGPPGTVTAPPSYPSTSSWSSRGISAHDMPLVNEQLIHPTSREDSTSFGLPLSRRRQTAFVHGAYVDATYLGESASSVPLNPAQPTNENLDFATQRVNSTRSGSGIAVTYLLGPQTGHSVYTDAGYLWTSEENSSMRDPSLQSYSTQSLSPALSTDQNPLQSPKLEQEDSDSSPKQSNNTPSESRKKPRRKTHNAIEKRYRVKLNEKIAELRDSIPSLRQQANITPSGSPVGESSVDQGAAQKINKANILEKATEYVKHLEDCNRRLQTELHQARAELRPQCHHPSHLMPQQNFPGQRTSHDSGYGLDIGPLRQGHNDGFYSVDDFGSDDVRQL